MWTTHWIVVRTCNKPQWACRVGPHVRLFPEKDSLQGETHRIPDPVSSAVPSATTIDVSRDPVFGQPELLCWVPPAQEPEDAPVGHDGNRAEEVGNGTTAVVGPSDAVVKANSTLAHRHGVLAVITQERTLEGLDVVSREIGVELYRLEAWKARALAGLELGLKEQAGEPRWPPSLMPPSDTLASCRWRTSCFGSVPAQRSVASLWRRGGPDDERNDLRDDEASFPARTSGRAGTRLGRLPS